MPTSALLIVSGLLCIALWAWTMHKLVPRPGQQPSPWTRTDFRAASVTLALLTLLVMGIGMIARGIF